MAYVWRLVGASSAHRGTTAEPAESARANHDILPLGWKDFWHLHRHLANIPTSALSIELQRSVTNPCCWHSVPKKEKETACHRKSPSLRPSQPSARWRFQTSNPSI
ncbi:hypothetical protein BJY01DRAFT_19566 [Aspergillus pseudoustus]|uniref:Uncharacterized protein n=1 Tax=Aspergillus pseudoustus TaxID=1810923 RepID=A0ABR4KRS7_9EURO